MNSRILYLPLRKLSILPIGCWIFLSHLEADTCRQASEALHRRDFESAEKLLTECLASNPAQLGPYLDLCGVYQAQGRAEDLVRVASNGMKRFPDERRFYLTVANHAGRNSQYERAIEVFSEAHRRWPQDLQFRQGLASAHLYFGMQWLDKGKNEDAERHLRKATTLAEQDVDAHLNLGRALHNLNRSIEAESEFAQVIALDPKVPLAWFHRGMVRQALGELDAAIGDLSEEIGRNPEYPPSYFLRGKAFQAKGLFREALADLEIAVRKMPDNAQAVFTRGRCRQQLGLEARGRNGLSQSHGAGTRQSRTHKCPSAIVIDCWKKGPGRVTFSAGSEKGRGHSHR